MNQKFLPTLTRLARTPFVNGRNLCRCSFVRSTKTPLLGHNLRPFASTRKFASQTNSKTNDYIYFPGRDRRGQAWIWVVAIGGGVYLAYQGLILVSQDAVPISGRQRAILMSKSSEQAAGAAAFTDFMKNREKDVLAKDHPISRKVEEISRRIIDSSGMPELKDNKWQFVVIDDAQTRNAFAVPGGKVVVFTGLLKIASTDDLLAAVLAHEIAHVLARHSAEKMTVSGFFATVMSVLAFTFGLPLGFEKSLTNILLHLPHSRTMESEADSIGLTLMARACYDPTQAEVVWDRFAQYSGSAPAILSTHPHPKARMEDMHKQLPAAIQERYRSNCFVHSEFRNSFNTWAGQGSGFKML